MAKLQNSKKKYIYITITILAVLAILVMSFLYEVFIGSITIRTKSDDYCNFEGFMGYSNLEVFPSNPMEIGEVTDYYYFCADTFMHPTCKVILECSFDNEEVFKEECTRLGQITVEKDDIVNEMQYSETLFNYPAYIAMYDWSSCYEYALIMEEQNKIVYVFLQGDSQKVEEEYMPISPDSGEDEFSIYAFGRYFELKYR